MRLHATHHQLQINTKSLLEKRRKISEQYGIDIPEEDLGSDTEPEDEDYAEALSQEYLNKMTDDVETPVNMADDHVSETSEEFTLEINQTIQSLSQSQQEQALVDDDSDEDGDSESEDDERAIKYPKLSTLSSAAFAQDLNPRDPSPNPIPDIVVHPPATMLPPPSAQTPAGYSSTYRPCRPNDTMYHRGSAGIDPLGAHNRLTRPGPSIDAMLATRPHRIVSGSFGSFEPSRPSRFDEREYRLVAAGEKRKREEKVKKPREADPFKGKPWLKRS